MKFFQKYHQKHYNKFFFIFKEKVESNESTWYNVLYGDGMKYEIKIDEFEGPFDLLLHLIKKNDVDIFAIEIEKITKQYLDYIEAMEELNLNIASEYLVMAAELIEIKSSILLPKSEFEDDDYEEDLKENLTKRLLEYQRYKEITKDFRKLEGERKEIYTKVGENLKAYQEENVNLNLDLNVLMEAFSKFLDRKEEEKTLHTTITKKEYSVKQRSREIKSLLKRKKQASFSSLFDVLKKDYIVVTFISILSMCKKQEVEIKQEKNFEEIYLSLKGENV